MGLLQNYKKNSIYVLWQLKLKTKFYCATTKGSQNCCTVFYTYMCTGIIYSLYCAGWYYRMYWALYIYPKSIKDPISIKLNCGWGIALDSVIC